MPRLFQSRLPAPITSLQIARLSELSRWSSSDIREWYERFIHCYPYGYLTLDEFGIYLQNITMYQNHVSLQLDKYIIKQIFTRFDKNNDKKLNFEELFLCNLFMHYGGAAEKLSFIFNLYERNKGKYYTREALGSLLMNLFDLFHIPGERHEHQENIQSALHQIHPEYRNSKISWIYLCRSMMKRTNAPWFNRSVEKEMDSAETDSVEYF